MISPTYILEFLRWVSPFMSLLFVEWGKLDVFLAIGLISSGVGNVFQFFNTRKDQTHTTDVKTITSWENAYRAKCTELELMDTQQKRLKTDLESVTEELKTQIGLDMKLVLDFAREGFTAENLRLTRHLARALAKLATHETGEGK